MLSDLSLFVILDVAIAIPVCGHIVLTKRTGPVAIGWIALVLLSPYVGTGIYLLFGINRIAFHSWGWRDGPLMSAPEIKSHVAPIKDLLKRQDRELFQFMQSVHDFEFLSGNSVDPLINGDVAYPAMLAAIESAKSSIALSVYIFDEDPAGIRFINALISAVSRGVAVRVLADDVGLRYSSRAVDRELRRGGVAAVRFIPRSVKFLSFLNLRNHRKLLVVDGREAFVGGMNIRHGHVLSEHPSRPVQDIHFRVVGPIIDQINTVFEKDWRFATKETIVLSPWLAATVPNVSARALARIVPDGPDDYFEKIKWIILGAAAISRQRILIMSPYFLPNEIVASALMVAALRGVNVEIIVPSRSNLPFMNWAMTATFERLIGHGVKIYTSSPPFDHSKIMVVDGVWSFVGSANWDQRSLRLNFELNLECYDLELGAALEGYFWTRRKTAAPIELNVLRGASLPVRLRNNLTALFSPYL